MIRINDVHSVVHIAQLANVTYIPSHHHCIAQYDKRDVLMGGVLYTDWNHGSLQMHFALLGGFAGMRPLLWLGFLYPFIQLGAKKVFALVPEWNVRSRNMCLHLGFEIEYLADDVFNNSPGVPNGMYLLSMRKENCRWLKMKPPIIEYAPQCMTNPINHPLYGVQPVGIIQ